MALEVHDRIVIPLDGEEHPFEVLYIFKPDNYEHDYVIVSPVEEDKESEEQEVFAFRFIDEGDEDDDLQLFAIETDEEWDMIEEMLDTVQSIEE